MASAYITAPPEAADELARGLVEKGYAACVNAVPCTSTYSWDGEIVQEEEMILIAKTTASTYSELVDWVRTEYPHEVPCIERFDETDVLPDYNNWVAEVTDS